MSGPTATPDVLLVEFDACRIMPWKNGGGTTREIHAHPQGAENFDWRLSIADVASDGAFSRFDGYARSIMLLEGAGMHLVSADGDTPLDIRVDEPFRPVDFDGGAATFCRLLAGPVRDFNIMSARDRIRHEHAVHAVFPALPDIGVQVIHALAGELQVTLDDGRQVKVMHRATLLLLDPRCSARRVDAVGNARALIVRFLSTAQHHGRSLG